ncbi:MAG: hypothetical protein V7707_09545 [Motiliproteus sp.]
MKGTTSTALALTLALTANVAGATVLDFADSNNLGVSLGGDMLWNGVGGGHLYNESWDTNDYILFSSATYVNSFEMNAMPWLNFSMGNIGLINIMGLNDAGQSVWSSTVDLSNYTNWNNWFTVSVETADISQLTFVAPGSAPHFNGFWPSVDNLTINEQVQNIPEPATIALGLGLVGVGFSARKKRA